MGAFFLVNIHYFIVGFVCWLVFFKLLSPKSHMHLGQVCFALMFCWMGYIVVPVTFVALGLRLYDSLSKYEIFRRKE